MTITELIAVAHANAATKGFYCKPKSPKDLIELCQSELLEALEAYYGTGLESWTRDDGKPEGLASELADVVILIASMSGYIGLDLEEHIAKKVAYNATRPYRHGGKRL